MRRIIICILGLYISLSPLTGRTQTPVSQDSAKTWSLDEIVDYALQHNPGLKYSQKGVEIEGYAVQTAQSNRMPRVDFNSWINRYRYPTPLTSINPAAMASGNLGDLYSDTHLATEIALNIPLYKGGQLVRAVKVAEIKEAMAKDALAQSQQDLVFNLASLYYKIGQLEKARESTRASVDRLEAHRKDVEIYLKAGTVPKVDLLKTEVELARRQQELLAVKNSIESASDLMKTLMGMEDIRTEIKMKAQEETKVALPEFEQALESGLQHRPEYLSLQKKETLYEQMKLIQEGRKKPFIYLSSGYDLKSGDDFDAREDWTIALKLNMPIYDAGNIKASTAIQQKEIERTHNQMQSLKLDIQREIQDAFLAIKNADDQIAVSQKAIESGEEDLRIQRLKYNTGAGTSTDVIDAQSALLIAQSNYYQAIFDKQIALASLRKAMGTQPHTGDAR